jgi:diacylglycerol kinase (ATP)
MKRIWFAFLNSLSGLRIAFQEESAFRQEVFLVILLGPLAFFLAPTGLCFAIMSLCIFLVLITELLNSGIEAAIDRVGLEYHPLSKKAKDVASAAVLLALINLVIVWGCILL